MIKNLRAKEPSKIYYNHKVDFLRKAYQDWSAIHEWPQTIHILGLDRATSSRIDYFLGRRSKPNELGRVLAPSPADFSEDHLHYVAWSKPDLRDKKHRMSEYVNDRNRGTILNYTVDEDCIVDQKRCYREDLS